MVLVRHGYQKYKGNLVNINFRPTNDLDRELVSRSCRPKLTEHQVAKRDLERYYYVLNVMDNPLDEDQTAAVAAALAKGNRISLLWAEVADLGHTALALELFERDSA